MRARFAAQQESVSSGGRSGAVVASGTLHRIGNSHTSHGSMDAPVASTMGAFVASNPDLLRNHQNNLLVVDEAATRNLLRGLMQNKSLDDDLVTGARPASRPASVGVGAIAGTGASAGVAHALPSASNSGSGISVRSPGSQKMRRGGASSPTFKEIPQSAPLSSFELEAERDAFMDLVCSQSTRLDVRDWVGKIFMMVHNAKITKALQENKDKRRRRLRRSTIGSESGLSSQTFMTGLTGTTATALLTAGGSIASPSFRLPVSPASDESLVVHHSKGDEPLSLKERLQAFLENRIPELEEHVIEHVAANTDKLQYEVDKALADKFLRQTTIKRVFDGQSNYLRWQNMRHQVLQQRLNDGMPMWIVDAIESWDQKKHMEDDKKKDYGEADRVFEYLTKRAAHIDIEKLPLDMPVIKTMHASYSLPSMWRDKYNNTI